MSKLAEFAKPEYKLYVECNKKTDTSELIKYIHKLLFGEKIFNGIPMPIENFAEKLSSR